MKTTPRRMFALLLALVLLLSLCACTQKTQTEPDESKINTAHKKLRKANRRKLYYRATGTILYHRIRPWTRRRCNMRFHRRQRHRLDGCATGLIFRRQCLVRRISAMSAVCLMRVSRRVSLRGCRKPMRQCSSNTPLSQRSMMSTSSAARGICTALCRSTRTRRLQLTVCSGTKNTDR